MNSGTNCPRCSNELISAAMGTVCLVCNWQSLSATDEEINKYDIKNPMLSAEKASKILDSLSKEPERMKTAEYWIGADLGKDCHLLSEEDAEVCRNCAEAAIEAAVQEALEAAAQVVDTSLIHPNISRKIRELISKES